LNSELRPAVEKAIAKHGFSSDRILVNVGDPKFTTNDEIREFNNLDKCSSEKQFICWSTKDAKAGIAARCFGVALFPQTEIESLCIAGDDALPSRYRRPAIHRTNY
jgi:hypothetical protein